MLLPCAASNSNLNFELLAILTYHVAVVPGLTCLVHALMQGLAFMHSRQRLHQSLGPASVLLNTRGEADIDQLQVVSQASDHHFVPVCQTCLRCSRWCFPDQWECWNDCIASVQCVKTSSKKAQQPHSRAANEASREMEACALFSLLRQWSSKFTRPAYC